MLHLDCKGSNIDFMLMLQLVTLWDKTHQPGVSFIKLCLDSLLKPYLNSAKKSKRKKNLPRLVKHESIDQSWLFGFYPSHLFQPNSSKMSSTTMERSLHLAEKGTREESGQRENRRAVMMEVRARRTKRLIWTPWKNPLKKEN